MLGAFLLKVSASFPHDGSAGLHQMHCGSWGRELGQVSATLDISPCSWHQLAPLVPHPNDLLALFHGGGGGRRAGVGSGGGVCQGQTWYKLTHRAPMP